MTRISALTPGINVPSSIYRVRQFIPALKEAGIIIDELPAKISATKLPGLLGRVRQRYIFPLSATWIGLKAATRISDIVKSNMSDAVWLNRVIVSSLFLENFIRKPLIFDVDDAIWINNEKNIRKIGQRAEIILAGNNYIAEWFCRYNSDIQIIPTAIDTNWFCPGDAEKGDLFKIIWTGTHQTIHYLLSIEKALAIFLNERSDARLIVVSDTFANFKFIDADKIDFVKWTPAAELQELKEAHVGLMPLFDSAWEKGKCSFKMLKYMACGLPVLVSPVGMNREVMTKGDIGFSVINDNDWIEKLEYFYNDRVIGHKMGISGRQVISQNYSLEIVSSLLEEIFQKF